MKDTPSLSIDGDFIAQDARWPTIRANNLKFHASLRAAGGQPEVVDLPALGIRGNSHMLMMDRNSEQVAALVQDWLVHKALWR